MKQQERQVRIFRLLDVSFPLYEMVVDGRVDEQVAVGICEFTG